jgi:membrane protease YdiL (CAAX protease family)
MKTKNKNFEEKLKIFILANIFFLFLFMFIEDEELKTTLLNISLSLLFLSTSLFYFRTSCNKLGLNKKNLAKGVVFGIIAFVSILFFTIFVEAILDLFGINASTGVEEILSQNIVLILSAIFISPLCEEIFFRATLIDFFEKNLKNTNFSIILSAIVFSVFHFGYGSFLEVFGAFVAGIILAFIYKKSKTLIAPITAHFLYNLLSISLLILNF